MFTSNINLAATGDAVKTFAALCVKEPSIAAGILGRLGDPGFTKAVHALMGHPGSVEALLSADTTPKWLKAAIEDVLADFGQLILS